MLFRSSLLRPADKGLAARIAAALDRGRLPVTVVLATGDATAIAFDDAWRGSAFAPLRTSGRVRLTRIETRSHSFADDRDPRRLADICISALRFEAAR